MTNKDWLHISQEQQKIYAGILVHHQHFAGEEDGVIRYDLSSPQFSVLREKYALDTIAGRGKDFDRAKRLMHNLAPRLKHSSWYDNHVPCNALDLLDYSLDQPEHGINCLNKSKILAECCLALGIYARRVSIMPYSPYDFDNHVVTEIYDRTMEKWVMLDITTDGYFVDENKNPLSLLEMRDAFARDEFVTFVSSADKLKDLQKSQYKNSYQNSYICKNLFYFIMDQAQGFGPSERSLFFCPKGFSVRQTRVANGQYRCNHLPKEYAHMKDTMEQWLQDLQAQSEPKKTALTTMEKSPIL